MGNPRLCRSCDTSAGAYRMFQPAYEKLSESSGVHPNHQSRNTTTLASPGSKERKAWINQTGRRNKKAPRGGARIGSTVDTEGMTHGAKVMSPQREVARRRRNANPSGRMPRLRRANTEGSGTMLMFPKAADPELRGLLGSFTIWK